jgi:hypothetical protein
LLSFSNPTRDIPHELKENRPKVKRIGCLGNNGDRPSSSLLGCALWTRDFIIKYNLGGDTMHSDTVETIENVKNCVLDALFYFFKLVTVFVSI